MDAKDIRQQFRGQIDPKTAEDMAPYAQAELEAAQRRWLENLPALKAAAQAAYDAAKAGGGKNAHKRAQRAARAVWWDFKA